MTIIGSAQVF